MDAGCLYTTPPSTEQLVSEADLCAASVAIGAEMDHFLLTLSLNEYVDATVTDKEIAYSTQVPKILVSRTTNQELITLAQLFYQRSTAFASLCKVEIGMQSP